MQLNALVIQKLLGIVVEILDRLDATLENSIIYVALNFHQIVMALCWLLASFFLRFWRQNAGGKRAIENGSNVTRRQLWNSRNQKTIRDQLFFLGITSFFYFASFPLEACSLPFLSIFWYWYGIPSLTHSAMICGLAGCPAGDADRSGNSRKLS